MQQKVLLLDDDDKLRSVLKEYLEGYGFRIVDLPDGLAALSTIRSESPDIVILDVMMPRKDGFDVLKEIRTEFSVPVIMLTARDTEIDRVVGLELGADDYVVKPFSVRELLARVRNVLRRVTAPENNSSDDVIEIGSLQIDAASREVFLGKIEVILTTLEFDVLHALAIHVGQVLTRDHLLEQVWGYDYPGDTRAVDAVIKRLRNKLKEADPHADFIFTVRGVGYKLRVD